MLLNATHSLAENQILINVNVQDFVLLYSGWLHKKCCWKSFSIEHGLISWCARSVGNNMVENSPSYSILKYNISRLNNKVQIWWLGYPDKRLCFTQSLIQTFFNPFYFEYVHYRLLYRIFENLLHLVSKLLVMFYITRR